MQEEPSNDQEAAAAAKAAWLEQLREEHQRNFRRRSMEARIDDHKVPEPDDAALKRDWLRRRREEHEAARASRYRTCGGGMEHSAPLEPDDAALKREWLRRRRQEHDAARASRGRVAEGWVEQSAPLVDPSLLSTPSERELYLRALAEEREFSRRERERASTEAARRPSLGNLQRPQSAGFAGRNDGGPDGDDRYCHLHGHDACSSPTPDGETSAANSTTTSAAERDAEDGSDCLDALEGLRLQELSAEHAGGRSFSGSSSGSGGGRGGDTRRKLSGPRLQISAPGILPSAHGRSSASVRPEDHRAAYYDECIPDAVPLAAVPYERAGDMMRLRAGDVMTHSSTRADGGQDHVGRAPNIPSLSFRQPPGEAWGAHDEGIEWHSPHSDRSSPGRSGTVLRLEDITIIKRR